MSKSGDDAELARLLDALEREAEQSLTEGWRERHHELALAYGDRREAIGRAAGLREAASVEFMQPSDDIGPYRTALKHMLARAERDLEAEG